MFSLVYNHLKIGIVVFHYLRMSPLYLQRVQVLFMHYHHLLRPPPHKLWRFIHLTQKHKNVACELNPAEIVIKT